MAGVSPNIDPPPPSPPCECVPPPPFWCGGRTHSLVGEGGGGSIFWKTSDTALYSTYVSTLCYTYSVHVTMLQAVSRVHVRSAVREGVHVRKDDIWCLWCP
jgi:hypothetical protein